MAAVPSLQRGAPDAHSIAEAALFADLTILVVLVGLYVPYAGAIMAAIAPIPLLLLAIRRGWRVTAEGTIVACLLVSFFAGPFSAVPVITIALRAASLGIGLRRSWTARRTVLLGTTFLWVVACLGVVAVAFALPSWRAATMHGVSLTYNQLTGLVGTVLTMLGQGQTWHALKQPSADFLNWSLDHWLLLLPLVSWPLLLIAVGAEYVIAEVVLPRFGITPPPLRLFGLQPAGQSSDTAHTGMREQAGTFAHGQAAVQQNPQWSGSRSSGRSQPTLEPLRAVAEKRAPALRAPHPSEGDSGD